MKPVAPQNSSEEYTRAPNESDLASLRRAKSLLAKEMFTFSQKRCRDIIASETNTAGYLKPPVWRVGFGYPAASIYYSSTLLVLVPCPNLILKPAQMP